MVHDWLYENAPGYQELNEEEKYAIMNFSWLWSLFEAQLLEYSASANSIQKFIKDWGDSGILQVDDFIEYKDYFAQRYMDDENTNGRFPHLHLREKTDKPGLVVRVLKNETNDVSEIVTALLIIVLRYRNNYFHGMKWAYGYEEQLDNFTVANKLLMKIMEIHWEQGN